jgi:glucose/arabinose dehydrogenase
MTGFLDSATQEFVGRPTFFHQMKDGALLISDEQVGAIYRVSYVKT